MDPLEGAKDDRFQKGEHHYTRKTVKRNAIRLPGMPTCLTNTPGDIVTMENKRMSEHRKSARRTKAKSAMSVASTLDDLFNRHGRMAPEYDPRLHSLRQAAIWLLEYHGAHSDERAQLLAHADAAQLMQTIRHVASIRRPRDPFRKLPVQPQRAPRSRIIIHTNEPVEGTLIDSRE
ncbi:MAG: hypothetical protein KDJ29_11170 [Hyphomicrobiales bacterium]|nr:hypothetical protein [Hyphomicrobiales bacterium]